MASSLSAGAKTFLTFVPGFVLFAICNLSACVADEVLTVEQADNIIKTADSSARWRPYKMNLLPAQWIWLPSQRTLPSTFLLFRHEVTLTQKITKATGWLTADSRYILTVNGKRVQFGPAPFDPRNMDVDPMDLTALLTVGTNVIGVEVLFYGHGDGTWPAGKPGFIFNLALNYEDGKQERIVSDSSWQVLLDRSHKPGQYKRWFLRSLQEEFDARLHPYGWDTAAFTPDSNWITATPIECGADKPATCSRYAGNDWLECVAPGMASLRMREIPALKETNIPVMRLVDAGRVDWNRNPADWFEYRMPNSFRVTSEPSVAIAADGNRWQLPAAANSQQGLYVMFEFKEEIVGWPYFTIDAPEGTVVDIMWQEAHNKNNPSWLDSQFHAWSKLTCRKGVNTFQGFDFEALRWLQLHVRNATGPVTISNVGVRRRMFDWPNKPQVQCSDSAIQKLLDASINTLCNSAQETVVDGMARERQQYSGDCGHQLPAIRGVFGESRLTQRFIRTFSEGQLREGYFMDSWPAFDRLARIPQKHLDSAYWGPIIDHSVGFNFDCWEHYLDTGDLRALDEAYPRLLKFADYLNSIKGHDGLVPINNLGIPVVWVDFSAFQQERHKICAFNLYIAAMLEHALAPIARARGGSHRADEFTKRSQELLATTVKKFWDPERKIFVNNLPWIQEEKNPRFCDRSLATAVLFDQCPGGDTAASVKALADCPPEMGISYPCNTGWRYEALAKSGRTDVVMREIREKWAIMPSVALNNTLQEFWTVSPDSGDQWSHCAIVPLYVFYNDIAGIRATTPGFANCQIRPQLADVNSLSLTYYTVRGSIKFAAQRQPEGLQMKISIPQDCNSELLLPKEQTTTLTEILPNHPLGLKRFKLPSGQESSFVIRQGN